MRGHSLRTRSLAERRPRPLPSAAAAKGTASNIAHGVLPSPLHPPISLLCSSSQFHLAQQPWTSVKYVALPPHVIDCIFTLAPNPSASCTTLPIPPCTAALSLHRNTCCISAGGAGCTMPYVHACPLCPLPRSEEDRDDHTDEQRWPLGADTKAPWEADHHVLGGNDGP